MDLKAKLVELIDEVQDEGCEYSNCLDRYDKPDYIENSTLADHLIAHGVTVQDSKGVEIDPFNKWISVEERLPENDYGKHWKDRKYYFVRLQNGTIRVATYGYKEYGWWSDSHHCVLDEKRYTGVTHWTLCNLPQPPKGE